jgi:hypothetical protein
MSQDNHYDVIISCSSDSVAPVSASPVIGEASCVM